MFTINLHNLYFFAKKQQKYDKSPMFLLLTQLLLVSISEARLMYVQMPLNSFFFLSFRSAYSVKSSPQGVYCEIYPPGSIR